MNKNWLGGRGLLWRGFPALLPWLLAALWLASGTSMAKSLVYEFEGKKYEGYLKNRGRNTPLIILAHDWDGLTEYEVKRSQMLYEMGYSVFAIDLFGQGVRPTEDNDKKLHTGELYKNREKLRGLLNAALATAKSQKLNVENAVALGYCFGGAAVLELARSGVALKGFVTFHGGLATPAGQDYSKTKGTILVFHGSQDSSITMTDYATLAVQLEKSSKPHEMITYGGAPHAFTVFGSDRYRKRADNLSWTRLKEFLKEQLRSERS